MGRYTQICEEPAVYAIPVSSKWDGSDWANVYLVKGKEQDPYSGKRNLLVDAGMYSELALETLTDALADLDVDMDETDIFLTHYHFDHRGLVPNIASFKTTIYMSRPDVIESIKSESPAYAQNVIDTFSEQGLDTPTVSEVMAMVQSMNHKVDSNTEVTFTSLMDGNTLHAAGYDFSVIDTPGHTPGHQCLYQPESKIMFLGDAVLTTVSPCFAPYNDWRNSDALYDFLTSLQTIDRHNVSIGCMGHGPSTITGPQITARVNELTQDINSRSQNIITVLREHEWLNATELVPLIPWNISFDNFSDLPVMQQWIMINEVVAHLDHLRNQGLVESKQIDGVWRYYPCK